MHQGQYTGHPDSRPVWKFYSLAGYFEVSNNVWVTTRQEKYTEQQQHSFNTWFNRHTDGKVHLKTILNLLPILQIIHLVF
jgi:hypothetical protein